MIGNKGITIVVVALLVTICVGFLVNADQVAETNTVYENRADLSPIFAMNSERENIAELYNSPYNVTGWTPNAMVSTQDTPNSYIITPESIEYNNFTKTVNLDGSGLFTKTGGTSTGITTVAWVNTDDGGKWYGTTTTTSTGNPVYGGWWTFHSFPTDGLSNQLSINGSGYQTGFSFAWQPLSNYWTPTNNVKLDYDTFKADNLNQNGTTGQYLLIYNPTFTTSLVNTYRSNSELTYTEVENGAYLVYNAPSHSWYVYDSDDTVLHSGVSIWLAYRHTSDDTTPAVFNYQAPQTYAATYADPTKLVNLINTAPDASVSVMPRWSNYEYNPSFLNERVSLIVKGAVNIHTPDVISITLDSDNRYIVNGQTIGVYPDGLYLVLNTSNKIITIRGITYANPSAPASDYTLTDWEYTAPWLNAPDQITIMYFQTETDAQIRVVDTWIYTDPDNKLWINFNAKLDDYFSQTLSENARVVFNGFVAYGSSITINGQTFNVTDGMLELPNGQTVRLNGMSIQYLNGKCAIYSSNYTTPAYDLGGIVSYTLSGTGGWYFTANLQSINQTITMVWHWFDGWTLSVNQAVLMFIGFMAAGLVIGLYFGRGALEFTDYMIMGVAIMCALCLMVV